MSEAQIRLNTLEWVRDQLPRNVRRCESSVGWLQRQITHLRMEAELLGLQLNDKVEVNDLSEAL